jgi:organic hydroperoxide reductase OsmC/OhrA
MPMYNYTVSLKLKDEKTGTLRIPEKSDIDVASPPEFEGLRGVWTPEDLFVAAVESCLMTTLLFFARKINLAISGYESTAEGTLEKGEKGFAFTSVKVDATLCVADEAAKAKVGENFAGMIEKHCLISHSIVCPVTFNLNVLVCDKDKSL